MMQLFFNSPLIAVFVSGSVICMACLTLAVCRNKHILWYMTLSWGGLVGILCLGLYCIDHVDAIARQGLQQNLSGLAKSFAIALKDAGHEHISLDAPDTDPLYWKIINMMSGWQKDIRTAASIYSFRKNESGEIVFICCPPADLDRNGFYQGEDEKLVPKGTIYEFTDPNEIHEILDAFWGRSGFNATPTSDEWGLWIAACEPIFDEHNENVEAVLGVDFWGDDWNAHIQHAVFWPKLFFFSFIMLFFVIQVFLIRRHITANQLAEYALNLEQITDELIEAKKESDIAVQAKSFFLANISHEIRTPMNAILGCADMLANAGLEHYVRADQDQLFEIMQRSCRSLMEIVDDVLTFSNIDTNRIILESVPLNLRQLIENVQSRFQGQLKEKPNVQFRLEWDESIPQSILGDPLRLRQIFIGLISNAIKFTSSGTITVRCGTSMPSDAMVSTEGSILFSSRIVPHLDPHIAHSTGLRGTVDPGASLAGLTLPVAATHIGIRSMTHRLLRVDVSDTGIGIAPDKFDTIFKTFSQIDGSTTRKFGGMGLGLSIIKGLVQLMGGEVLLRSKLGRGSKFSVLLPLIESYDSAGLHTASFSASSVNQPVPKMPPKNDSAKKKPLSECNILIVDDVPVNRIVLEARLLEMGAKIQSAANGQEAVNLAEAAENSKEPFDLILMDLQMPVMDGFEASRILRRNGFTKPIAALTANMNSQSEAFESGCNIFLSKPVSKETLSKTILELIHRG